MSDPIIIDPTPTAVPPVVPPIPAPVPTPVVFVPPDWFMRSCMVFMILILLFDRPGSAPVTPPVNPPITPPPVTPPAPVADLKTVGHAYVVNGLAKSWADAMTKASISANGTSSMSDIQKEYTNNFNSGIKSSFNDIVKPNLEAVLPSGDVLDATTRPKVSKAFSDLAKGSSNLK